MTSPLAVSPTPVGPPAGLDCARSPLGRPPTAGPRYGPRRTGQRDWPLLGTAPPADRGRPTASPAPAPSQPDRECPPAPPTPDPGPRSPGHRRPRPPPVCRTPVPPAPPDRRIG